jgi:hypothetical protein
MFQSGQRDESIAPAAQMCRFYLAPQTLSCFLSNTPQLFFFIEFFEQKMSRY